MKEVLVTRRSRKPKVRICLSQLLDESRHFTHCWSSAGWTYCALGALSLLGRLPYIRKAGNGQGYEKNDDNSSTIQSLLHWLTSRQTSLMQGDGEYKVADGEHIEYTKTDKPDLGHVQRTMFPRSEDPWSTNPNLEVMPDDLLWAGFNGRCNKIADTCYSFWAGGTLAVRELLCLLNDYNNEELRDWPTNRL